MLSRDQNPAQREVQNDRSGSTFLTKTGSHDRLPAIICSTREGYFGACTTIRLAVMVNVPLMLGMGLPSRS